MLTHITINNFTLVEHLDLDLKTGMTAITGETGTGKSILLDALTVALGERTDAERVRLGADRADITATFSLDDLPEARQWLIDNDLHHADECLLRRIVTSEGRSRSYINGQPTTLQQVRTLGELLISIHSQHAHQSLLQKNTHQRLLDEFAQQRPLLNDVGELYQQWQTRHKEFITLRDNADEVQARYKLLSYQVEELEQLSLEPGELSMLEQEQATLSNADSIIANCQQLSQMCDNEQYGIVQNLQQTLRLLGDMNPKSHKLEAAEQLLNSALIHVEEAQHEINYQIDHTEQNPERLHTINERLSACYDIARKHHIQPEELHEKHQQLSSELATLNGSDEALENLQQQAQLAHTAYLNKAKQLSKVRHKAASTITQKINKQLSTLAMGNADFMIAINTTDTQASATGIDQIEFMISTNPGQPHKALGKVASGGELSRISLAIQVATAQTSDVATLVFDEVDVGIGGATADVVGRLLATLGGKSQVLCVTHLAQVASKAHQHWLVSKKSHKGSTQSSISELSSGQKIAEIARMISGSEVSKQSLEHAREMLEPS